VADVRRLSIPSDGPRGRADRWAADLSGLSRSHVQKLITDGRLTVGGLAVKANTFVEPGSVLELTVPPPAPARPIAQPEIPVEIVYEDADLLIVNKPAGLVVHPSAGHDSGTLVNALLALGGELAPGGIAGVQRPGIVHRLDRDTSGLLMVARTDAAQASLQAQLKARRVKKTYLALVLGIVAAAAGRIEAPIGRDPSRRTRMAVTPGGRDSTTGYRVREAIGHPVAGDLLYGTGTSRRGPDAIGRLFLHAWRLELTSPSTGRLIRAEAPLPPELEDVLAEIRTRAALA